MTNAYRGDRYIFLESGSQDAMLLKTVWTSHAAATAAKTAWVQSIRKRLPNARVTRNGATTTAQGNVSVYFHVSGSTLRVAYAPTPALAQQFGTAATN